MHMKSLVLFQPGLDVGMSVRPVVIADDINSLAGGHGLSSSASQAECGPALVSDYSHLQITPARVQAG